MGWGSRQKSWGPAGATAGRGYEPSKSWGRVPRDVSHRVPRQGGPVPSRPSPKSRPARKIRVMREGTVEYVRFESRVLRGNPLGDPYVRTIPVYLPPGYDDAENTRRDYPVVYVLAGFTGRGTMLLNDSGWTEPIHRRLDRLIDSGKVQPLIAVLPDGFTRYGGSQYLDSSAHGDYETHLVGEE